MIIRATQKKMISPPVTRTLVGWNVSRSFVFSGQPIGENVQSHDENHVSSTSSSCASLRARALRAARRLVDGDDRLLAVAAVPHGDPVPPPELPRDAPVPDILHPGEVDVPPALGREGHLSPLRRRDARRGERLHPEKPLPRDVRLDRRAAAVVVADRVLVVVDLPEQPLLLERGEDLLSAPRACRAPAKRPASALIFPSRSMTTTGSSLCLRPIRKSVASCPGVTFRHPVPNAGSTASSKITGIVRPVSGSIEHLPLERSGALVLRDSSRRRRPRASSRDGSFRRRALPRPPRRGTRCNRASRASRRNRPLRPRSPFRTRDTS